MVLREIFVKQYANIRRDEWPIALLMSAFFFLVIATYWILKPLKRGVIINYFGDHPLHFLSFTFSGAEAEQIGKGLNVVAVYFVLMLFTFLVRRCPRHYLVAIFAAISSGAFVFYASVIDELNQLIVWSFYVFGDMFNTALVALFWAFSNDIVTTEQSKRTYGVVGLGGVVGGFFGASVVSTSVNQFGRAPLLLFCIVPMILVTIIAFRVERRVRHSRGIRRERAAAGQRRASPAVEGARLVFRSKYLIGIASIIAIYELVSNVIDFQLASTVERAIEASLAKDAFFGLVGQIIGIASIAVQLLLTGFVLQRFGVRIALLFLPISLLAGSTGFLLLPTLLFAAVMSASDNALNYSINQSAKEALYVPTSEEVTYKAKAFIDMFVQRFAKVISVLLNLVLIATFVENIRWLSLVTLGLGALWIWLIWFVSTEYRKKEESPRASKTRRGEEWEPGTI